MELEYDLPVEVSQSQYEAAQKYLAKIVARRYDPIEKKYFIKVWKMKEKEKVRWVLENF